MNRIQSWFHRPYLKEAEREEQLRVVERMAERARIARELHDTLFQGFLSISFQLQHAFDQLPEDSPGRAPLSRTMDQMHRVLEDGRGVLDGLRSSSLASMNLEHALSVLRDELNPSENVRFRIFVTGKPRSLKNAIREQIYLIGREALFNAVRHSRATSIEAEVEYLPRRLRVIVRDNGCGMDPDAVRSRHTSHWGLQGMRERAVGIGAQLRIWSRLGSGTEVELCFPQPVTGDAGA